MPYTVLEICAGAGGQALGLQQAGFKTVGAVELDAYACQTLRINRPEWAVYEQDLRLFSAKDFRGVDLIAGGVPCPPFSDAGKRLGADDERDLFPSALRLVDECQPKAVMLENVRGLSSSRFKEYRMQIASKLINMGYQCRWQLVYSNRFGVPQLRPRFVLVALKNEYFRYFQFPEGDDEKVTVGETLFDLMSSNGWKGAVQWKDKANDIAPTLVGGSKKHGGADLGPTRAKSQWLRLGVDAKGVANEPPSTIDGVDFIPRLTVRMVARLQGFPDSWVFAGGKTAQYRQIGNAFPPPVARAIGENIITALSQVHVGTTSNIQLELDAVV